MATRRIGPSWPSTSPDPKSPRRLGTPEAEDLLCAPWPPTPPTSRTLLRASTPVREAESPRPGEEDHGRSAHELVRRLESAWIGRGRTRRGRISGRPDQSAGLPGVVLQRTVLQPFDGDFGLHHAEWLQPELPATSKGRLTESAKPKFFCRMRLALFLVCPRRGGKPR